MLFLGVAIVACLVAPVVASSSSASDYYVWDLPGFDHTESKFPLMHAGNLQLAGSDKHASMFFWHVASEYMVDKPRTVLWFNGGPGCSSLDGALMEIGPFRVEKQDKLVPNPHSWHKYANVLFIDQPVGVGFSTSPSDSYVHTLPDAANDLVAFLDKYITVFPEILATDIYLAGESFAGQYIPYIAKAIFDRNDQLDYQAPKKPESPLQPPKQYINLKGMLIGNGWIDPIHQYLAYLPFTQSRGLLSAGDSSMARLEQLHQDCAQEMSDMGPNLTVHTATCEKVPNGIIDALRKDDPQNCINIYDVRLKDAYPACGLNWPPDLQYMNPYLRREDVLKALNTFKEGTRGWTECKGAISTALRQDPSPPSVRLLPDLLERIPLMLFNGEQDFVCNNMGVEDLIANLDWKGSTGFGIEDRPMPVYLDDREIARVITARDLTYANLLGASHMSPWDHGEETQMLFHVFAGLAQWTDNNNITMGGAHRSAVEKDKIVSDATHKAYFRAGGAVLIIVVIGTVVAGYLIWRQRKLYEDTNVTGSGDKNGLLSSFFNGIARWRSTKRTHGAKYFGLRSASSGGRTRLHMNDSDIILEDDEEYNLDSRNNSPEATPESTPAL